MPLVKIERVIDLLDGIVESFFGKDEERQMYLAVNTTENIGPYCAVRVPVAPGDPDDDYIERMRDHFLHASVYFMAHQVDWDDMQADFTIVHGKVPRAWIPCGFELLINPDAF